MSMFVHSYENDLNVDFVVFTIEHYYTILIVILILPFMCGLFIAGLLLESLFWTYEQEEGLLALVFLAVFFMLWL